MNEEIPALTQAPVPNKTSRNGDPAAPPETEADASASAEAAAHPAPEPSSSTEPRRSALGWWALLIALIALLVAGWAVWQARATHSQAGVLREELAQRLNEGGTVAAEARGIARQQQETIASLQGKLGALETKVEATEGQAEALEALYQEFSRTREDGVVAEIEQAVVAAAQQLQLAGNVEAALIALQGADARLALHDRGQIAPLRRALGKDIEKLKLHPVIDVPGMALRLERLLERADAMPLAFERELAADAADVPFAAEAAAEGEDWLAKTRRVATELAVEVWSEVRSLVRVERLDGAEPVLLAPAQSSFLRENLKIRLLTARLALLARDGRTYAADLAQARQWVERFFDKGDARVQAALEELKALEAIKVTSEVPMLTESFAALRKLQVGGDRSLPAEPPQAATPQAATPQAATPQAAPASPPAPASPAPAANDPAGGAPAAPH